MNWQRWFAWYPVRVGGFAIDSRWYRREWAWLCWVEWAEGHLIGDWIYRRAP
jgi:hypothetical protein